MALTLKAYKQRLAPQVFQGREELLCLLDVTAQILLAVKDQERRVYVLHVRNRRHAHVAVEIIPGSGIQFVVGKSPAEVAGAEVRCKVDYAALRLP